eukprot:TRINITY_DN5002_c0_g2_i1.p1 TRINITY_DN5002_c0_g2~~TRINITY_DN5002_c0_g2_i1.p1  ORF type:complete len:523 (+),score=122.85 TRINITY_DN5002_c0_g2_i1:54-1622(+)
MDPAAAALPDDSTEESPANSPVAAPGRGKGAVWGGGVAGGRGRGGGAEAMTPEERREKLARLQELQQAAKQQKADDGVVTGAVVPPALPAGNPVLQQIQQAAESRAAQMGQQSTEQRAAPRQQQSQLFVQKLLEKGLTPEQVMLVLQQKQLQLQLLQQHQATQQAGPDAPPPLVDSDKPTKQSPRQDTHPAAAEAEAEPTETASKKYQDEMWVCPNCHSLAHQSMPVCPACKTPRPGTAGGAGRGTSLADAYAGLPTELADKTARKGVKGGKGEKGAAPAGRGAAVPIAPPPAGRGVSQEPSSPEQPTGRSRGQAVPAGRGAPAPAAGRGAFAAGTSSKYEWVAAGAEAKAVDADKEIATAKHREKEKELDAMKKKLALLEKKKKLKETLSSEEPSLLRVDEHGDQKAYTRDEITAFYGAGDGLDKWVEMPKLGTWGMWGMAKPGNVEQEVWLGCCLAEAEAKVAHFKELKAKHEEEKQKLLVSNPVVVKEINKAREEAERAKEENAKLLEELARLRALAGQ